MRDPYGIMYNQCSFRILRGVYTRLDLLLQLRKVRRCPVVQYRSEPVLIVSCDTRLCVWRYSDKSVDWIANTSPRSSGDGRQ